MQKLDTAKETTYNKIKGASMEKNTHGGKREGAGRPKNPNPEELRERHQVRMNKKEWELFKANGGAKTLRHLINTGQFKK